MAKKEAQYRRNSTRECHSRLQIPSPDGKQRLADALDAECVQTVANNYPNNRALLQGAMTDKINDREIFMKGIDYSYYYEQSDLVSEEPNSLGSGVLWSANVARISFLEMTGTRPLSHLATVAGTSYLCIRL